MRAAAARTTSGIRELTSHLGNASPRFAANAWLESGCRPGPAPELETCRALTAITAITASRSPCRTTAIGTNAAVKGVGRSNAEVTGWWL